MQQRFEGAPTGQSLRCALLIASLVLGGWPAPGVAAASSADHVIASTATLTSSCAATPASRYRVKTSGYSCGARLMIRTISSCVVARVVGTGLAAAPCGLPELRVTHQLAQEIVGLSALDAEECTVVEVARVVDHAPLGRCDPSAPPALHGAEIVDPGPEPLASDRWIGAACGGELTCSVGSCLLDADGYSHGMCTRICSEEHTCPQGELRLANTTINASSVCIVRPDRFQETFCVAACDTRRWGDTGCRSGYRCDERERAGGGSVHRVCLPGFLAGAAKTDRPGSAAPAAGCGVGAAPETSIPLLLAIGTVLALLRGRRRRGLRRRA